MMFKKIYRCTIAKINISLIIFLFKAYLRTDLPSHPPDPVIEVVAVKYRLFHIVNLYRNYHFSVVVDILSQTKEPLFYLWAAALLFFLLVIYPVFDVSIDRDALSNIVSIDIIDDIASQGNTFPYIIAIDIINDIPVRRLPFSDKITVNSVDNVAPRHLSLMDVVTDDIIENVSVRCYTFSD